MDLKERYLFNYYKNRIEEDKFTEIDIYGFLILMRSYIYDNPELMYIREFADLIAHRQRNQGLIQGAIKKAIKNEYEMIVTKDGDKIMGYNGILNEKWDNEWRKFAKDNNMKISDKIIKGITMCIFSLVQNTKYYYKNDKKKNKLGKKIGKVVLIAERETNSICLATTEGHKHSIYMFCNL